MEKTYTKQQLLDESRMVAKMMKTYISASNMPFPLKERFDNFFQGLVKFLHDEVKGKAATDLTPPGLFNDIQNVDDNMKYLETLFTKQPTDIVNNGSLATVKESKDTIKESLDVMFKDSVKKMAKPDTSG